MQESGETLLMQLTKENEMRVDLHYFREEHQEKINKLVGDVIKVYDIDGSTNIHTELARYKDTVRKLRDFVYGIN